MSKWTDHLQTIYDFDDIWDDREPAFKLTRHDQDGVPSRLRGVLLAAYTLWLWHNPKDEPPFGLVAMHDHKGTLTCTWQFAPDEKRKRIMSWVWAQFAEYEIEHVVGKAA